MNKTENFKFLNPIQREKDYGANDWHIKIIPASENRPIKVALSANVVLRRR